MLIMINNFNEKKSLNNKRNKSDCKRIKKTSQHCCLVSPITRLLRNVRSSWKSRWDPRIVLTLWGHETSTFVTLRHLKRCLKNCLAKMQFNQRWGMYWAMRSKVKDYEKYFSVKTVILEKKKKMVQLKSSKLVSPSPQTNYRVKINEMWKFFHIFLHFIWLCIIRFLYLGFSKSILYFKCL